MSVVGAAAVGCTQFDRNLVIRSYVLFCVADRPDLIIEANNCIPILAQLELASVLFV